MAKYIIGEKPNKYNLIFDDQKNTLNVSGKQDVVIGGNNNIKTEDYTAFEVFAHDYNIPVGECEELGGYVNVEIPSGITHHMNLRTSINDFSTLDVMVD